MKTKAMWGKNPFNTKSPSFLHWRMYIYIIIKDFTPSLPLLPSRLWLLCKISHKTLACANECQPFFTTSNLNFSLLASLLHASLSHEPGAVVVRIPATQLFKSSGWLKIRLENLFVHWIVYSSPIFLCFFTCPRWKFFLRSRGIFLNRALGQPLILRLDRLVRICMHAPVSCWCRSPVRCRWSQNIGQLHRFRHSLKGSNGLSRQGYTDQSRSFLPFARLLLAYWLLT